MNIFPLSYFNHEAKEISGNGLIYYRQLISFITIKKSSQNGPHYRYLTPLFLIILGWICPLTSQSHLPDFLNRKQETGFPYIHHYSQTHIKGSENFSETQTWCIARRKTRELYFGFLSGLLKYNGNDWLRQTNLGAGIASLAIDEDDKIYAGGIGNLGYFEADRNGELIYHSLLDYIPPQHRTFKDVWTTIIMADGVYFQSSNYLFRWAEDTMMVWKPKKNSHLAFKMEKKYLVSQPSIGLMEMVDDSLRFAYDGAAFKGSYFFAMLPYQEDTFLVMTWNKGLFLYNQQTGLRPFPSELETYFPNYRFYHGAKLVNGDYAFSTLRNGVVVIDSVGKIQYTLNKNLGLQDNYVTYVLPDSQGGFWLALNNGISHIEAPYPVSFFDSRSGFEGTVQSIQRHRGRLYFSTSEGAYYLENAEKEYSKSGFRPSAKPVPGINVRCRKLFSTPQALLFATRSGAFKMTDRHVINFYPKDVSTFYRSKQDTNRIFAGSSSGLISFYLSENQWQFEKIIADIKGEIRTIYESPAGELWLGTGLPGVTKVTAYQSSADTLSKKRILAKTPTISRFDHKSGLPENKRVYVYEINNRPLFAAESGIYRFQQEIEKFVIDTTFDNAFITEERSIFKMVEDVKGNVWISTTEYENYIAYSRPGGGYFLDKKSLKRIPYSHITAIFPEANGITWFASSDGLIRYDSNIERRYDHDFNTLISRVTTGKDSLLVAGSHLDFAKRYWELPYGHNSLNFQYAAPSFENESANQFQFMLEGFDENWSAWQSENRRTYTNLPEGEYRFRVRAKNVYDHLGKEAFFSFKIFPPWYRAWWAFLLYGIAGISLINGLFLYRTRHLKQRAEELEGVVKERTAEVVAQKDQLEAQAEQLKELDKLKSRFFANISHEFRTPLTLILGPLDSLHQRLNDEADRHELGMMKRNGRRLLNLINQLLDLARLESGKLILEARPSDFMAFIRGITFSFESLAKQRNIELRFDASAVGDGSLEIYFDPDKLDKVFINLLANAFKFTKDGGKISVVMEKPRSIESEMLQITISDTGTGIEPAQLPHIFDRFYTVDKSYNKQRKGTGIGLALTKEFLELHHGSISVTSELGEGSAFTVSLPLGKDHLEAEEIADYMSPAEVEVDIIKEMIKDEMDAPVEASVEKAATVSEQSELPTLLIVEDNLDMRNFIRSKLRDGYQILEAVDGQAGLEKAVETMPDLVVSDVMMPRMDGYQLCEKLKTDERTSHIPVVLLTAKSSGGSKIEGLELGADDYLVKPFVARELRARIKNLIELRRKLRERFSKELIKIEPGEITVTPVDEKFLKRAMAIVEENMAEETFSVEIFAGEIGMSRAQLHRKLKSLTDQSPSDFIRILRLKRAAQLLEKQSGNITEVAYDVGFNNLSYFSKRFQEQFGMLPKAYAKKFTQKS